MEDFFDKIKKKLSVDNILDLMKDGKLKDELKQTLTATVNLNEKPKQEESRPIVDPLILEPNKHVTIENIQHNTAQGQTKANQNEISQSDEKPLKEVEKQIVLETHQQNVTEEQESTLESPKEQPQDKVESIETKIILHEVPRTGEETLKEAQKPLLSPRKVIGRMRPRGKSSRGATPFGGSASGSLMDVKRPGIGRSRRM
ncbi:unnamed protein product, partial [Iphiclides podalirius]